MLDYGTAELYALVSVPITNFLARCRFCFRCALGAGAHCFVGSVNDVLAMPLLRFYSGNADHKRTI